MDILRIDLLTKEYSDIESAIFKLTKGDTYITNEVLRKIEEEIASVKIYEDTLEVLENLQSKYKLYLLSNIATPYKQAFFSLGLEKYFTKAFFSCDMGSMKPDKTIFEQVLKETNLSPSDFLMIGNSYKSDYSGAISAGMNAYLLLRQPNAESSQTNVIHSLKDLL